MSHHSVIIVKVLSSGEQRGKIQLLPSRRSYLRRRKVDKRLTEKTKSILLASARLGFPPSSGELEAIEFVKRLNRLLASECRTAELHLPPSGPVRSGWARNRRNRRPNLASHSHLGHTWAGGWRCWLCPTWSRRPLKGRCPGAGAAPTPDVSLSFYDNRLPLFRPDSRLEEGSDDSWSTDWEPTIHDSNQLSRTRDVDGPSSPSSGRSADDAAVDVQIAPVPPSIPSPTSCQTGSGKQPPASSSSAPGGEMRHSPTRRLLLANPPAWSSSTSTGTRVARHSISSSTRTDHSLSLSGCGPAQVNTSISSIPVRT
jgi:hypothetical protein